MAFQRYGIPVAQDETFTLKDETEEAKKKRLQLKRDNDMKHEEQDEN
jgi:hypothetical protein